MMNMNLERNRRKSRKIYEGKAKILYKDGRYLIQHFKDDATAFNAQKKTTLVGKGILNNLISCKIMQGMSDSGIDNHFIRRLSWREQLVHPLQMLPLEVIVRNIAAGSICKRLGLKEGERFSRPLVEFCLKSDELGDPLVSEDHILCFEWASPQDIDDVTNLALRTNDFLCGLFVGMNVALIDFKLEFGRTIDENGQDRLMVGDEVSPDTCRLWDKVDNRRLDKDRFRFDLGEPLSGYQEIARRLGVLPAVVLNDATVVLNERSLSPSVSTFEKDDEATDGKFS